MALLSYVCLELTKITTGSAPSALTVLPVGLVMAPFSNLPNLLYLVETQLRIYIYLP